MSTIDLLTRVNGIIKKYENYDAERPKEGAAGIASNDHFLKLYRTIEDEVNDVLKKVAEAEHERNRAVIATLNAEVRRAKAALRLELPKLHKLAPKKVKGVKAEEILARPNMALALAARIEEVPEGATAIRKKVTKGQPLEIRIENYSPEDIMRSGAVKEHSAESKGFSEEYEVRKKQQDEGLEAIQRGLSTLKDMAHDIGEELNRQDQLVEEADTKTEQATTEMKTANSRLKETVTAMRSSRNFCIDVTLLVIILGIAAYLYKALKK